MAANRSDAISFIGLALLYGYFVYGLLDGGLDQPDLVGRTIGFYVLTALILGAIQIVAAIAFGEGDQADREAERDIGRRSGRNAYIAVLSVLWAVPFLLAVPNVGVNLTMVACVGVMGLAEVVRYGSRLVYRGLGAGRNQHALAG